MSKHYTPTDVCLAIFGDEQGVAHICDVGRHTIYIWKRPSKHREAGDIPSSLHQRSLLLGARARNIPLTEAHLIWGASEEDVAALRDAANRNNAPQAAE